MSEDSAPTDKMITGSAAKRPFHFSGDGIYHNMALFASNIEEATKQWLEKRRLIAAPLETPTQPAEQSTPAEKSAPEAGV